jgi:glycosyltransferase involved in cell wall biosynthesis
MTTEYRKTNIHDERQIMVSIICTTYNHEAYIAKALDGFLMQQTNFPIEIIVHDDASTDNTATIIRQYEAKYPHLLVCIYQKENQYFKRDIWNEIVFPAACGKYVALCEGDDYWTDPLKLQKQVAFLEKNPDYGLVYTDFQTVDKDGNPRKRELRRKALHPSGDVRQYLKQRNFIQTVTVLLNTSLLKDAAKFLSCQKFFSPFDYPLFLELSGNTKFYYLPDATSAYRVLHESASHSSCVNKRISFAENNLKVLRYYNDKYSFGFTEKKFRRIDRLDKLREYSIYKEKKAFYSFLVNSIMSDIGLLLNPCVYYHLLNIIIK